jgi:hypothetical protein
MCEKPCACAALRTPTPASPSRHPQKAVAPIKSVRTDGHTLVPSVSGVVKQLDVHVKGDGTLHQGAP